MAGKDDIETAAAHNGPDTAAAPPRPADVVLKGFAGRLAEKLAATGDGFLAEPDGLRPVLETARIITGLARAATTLHQTQAQEDKAAERLAKRTEEREVAKTRARVRQHFNPDEDDDTDMNGRDSRLDDPRAMAEVRTELCSKLDALGLEIKAAKADRRAAGRGLPLAERQLADPQPPEPALAAH